MKTHKDLAIWSQGILLVERIYGLVASFPTAELYGLTSQMKRSAVSISSNIAEGAARHSEREFLQFLYISLGSLSELEIQCFIAKRLGFMHDDEIFEELEVQRKKMLNFIKHLKSRLEK